MPYNPKLQANLVVDRPYHSMMKAIAHSKGQTLRRGLELVIEAEYRRNDLQDSDVQSEVSGDSKAQSEAQRKDN